MSQVHPLRKLRLERGWTLDDMARRLVDVGRDAGEDNLGATANTVGRWERGEHQPGPPYPKLLCALFQTTASELGLVGGFPNGELCGRLEDVDRRDVLHLLSIALAAPVLLRGEAEADRLTHAVSKPSRVDHEAVSIIEAEIANARRLDDVLGSRVAARPVLAQRDVIRVLLQGGPSGPVADRLTLAGAEVCQLLGFLTLNMNDQATSRRYFGEALELAHEAGNDDLGAYVLGHLSIAVGGRVRPEACRDGLHEGLAFAQAATGRAAATGSAATQSWLAAVEAEALSSLGDRIGTERALDRARTTFAQLRPEDVPPWLYYYGTAVLEASSGLAYLNLGLAEPARRATEFAIKGLGGSMVRDRAALLARLAQTYVPDGEVDEACRVGGEALTIATDTRSDWVVLRVRRLRTQLEPWASEPMVRELDDQLASTAAWVHAANVA